MESPFLSGGGRIQHLTEGISPPNPVLGCHPPDTFLLTNKRGSFIKTDQIERSPNFYLFLAAGTLLGILEALFEMSGDVPETEPELTRFHAKLSGLTASGRRIARELHDFLHEARDRHPFPYSYAQLDRSGGMIGDSAPPIFLVRSR